MVAEDDDADFRLLKAQRQSGDALSEIEHLVEHHITEPLDARHAVADFANHADALAGGGGLGAGYLRLDFVYQVRHALPLAHYAASLLRSVPPASPNRLLCCRRRRRCQP